MEKKTYSKIEFTIGSSLDDAIKQMSSYKEPVFGEFNGKTLYSDEDIDSAYLKITGKTKKAHDALVKKEQDRYEEEKRKHEQAIPELTKEWIEKGKAILDEKHHERWEKCVPIRLGDLYRGMELGCCLGIVKALNEGCDLDAAKSIIDSQGHSGMSFGLVCSMVKAFCERGSEFVDYVNKQP